MARRLLKRKDVEQLENTSLAGAMMAGFEADGCCIGVGPSCDGCVITVIQCCGQSTL